MRTIRTLVFMIAAMFVITSIAYASPPTFDDKQTVSAVSDTPNDVQATVTVDREIVHSTMPSDRPIEEIRMPELSAISVRYARQVEREPISRYEQWIPDVPTPPNELQTANFGPRAREKV